MLKLFPLYIGLFMFTSLDAFSSWEFQSGYQFRQVSLKYTVTDSKGSLSLNGVNLRLEKTLPFKSNSISLFSGLDYLKPSGSSERNFNKTQLVNSEIGFKFQFNYKLFNPHILYRSRKNLHIFSSSPRSLSFLNYISNEMGIGLIKETPLKGLGLIRIKLLFFYGDGDTNSQDVIYSSQGFNWSTSYQVDKHEMGIQIERYERKAKIFPQEESTLMFVYRYNF